MIDEILNVLKNEVGGQIMEKANIPSDKLDSVMNVIGDSAKKEVVSQMTSGNLSTMMNLFSNNKNSHGADDLQSSIQNNIVSGLIQKLGLSESIANTISNIAVPALIGLITKKNNETPDDDPSPLNDIFGNVMNNKGGGNILGGLFN
jgi:uncharacterized protein YidB (DUF937 family)